MANFAEIVGDEVRFYDRSLIDAKPLTAFLSEFQPVSGWASPRLPTDCKFVSGRQNYSMYVVEKPPRIVTLRCGYGLDQLYADYNEPTYTDESPFYYVPVPWEYYVMAIADKAIDTGFGQHNHLASQLHLFWSKTKVEDLEQTTLVPASLPNIGSTGGVCLGETSSEYDSPHEKLSDTVNDFYESDFNGDMGATSGPCRTIEEWLNYAYNNPNKQIDLTDSEFNNFPTSGGNLLEIMSADSFGRINPPDPLDPATPRAFINKLMVMLPENDGRRLMAMLRSALKEGAAE